MNEIKFIVKDKETDYIVENANIELLLQTPEEPGKAPQHIKDWAGRTNKRGEVIFFDMVYNGNFSIVVKKFGFKKYNEGIDIKPTDTEKTIYLETA